MKTKTAPDLDLSCELEKLAADQRQELLEEFHHTLVYFHRGLERFVAEGWKWDPLDMKASDPNEWKRIAKLCLILAQLYAIQHAIQYQDSTKPRAPFWCTGCKGDYPGAPYLRVECLDHDATPTSAYEWARLFGAP